MGNIFGRETYYVSNVRFHPVTPIYEYYDDTYTGEEDYSQPYGWGQFFSDLCCGAEWEDSGWGGAVVGIAKRRGCVRLIWSLLYYSMLISLLFLSASCLLYSNVHILLNALGVRDVISKPYVSYVFIVFNILGNVVVLYVTHIPIIPIALRFSHVN